MRVAKFVAGAMFGYAVALAVGEVQWRRTKRTIRGIAWGAGLGSYPF